MLTFKQFLLESATGNYVALVGSDGVMVPRKDQHVTLMFSKGTDVSNSKILTYLNNLTYPITAGTDQALAFDSVPKEGERDLDLCTIVLGLDGPELSKIHSDLVRMGMKHSYPEFHPHVSLVYTFPRDRKDSILKFINDYLGKNKVTVQLDTPIANPIDDHYIDKLKKK